MNYAARSQEKNKQMAITGLLLFRDGFFIQVLEGHQKMAEELFEHIKDPRHYNVFRLYNKPIAARRFPNWSMGFETPNLDSLKNTTGFSDFMQLRQTEISDSMATQIYDEVDVLLNQFIELHAGRTSAV